MMTCLRELLRVLAGALCTEQVELVDSWKAIYQVGKEGSRVDDQSGSK